jgi:hypothetical protein
MLLNFYTIGPSDPLHTSPSYFKIFLVPPTYLSICPCFRTTQSYATNELFASFFLKFKSSLLVNGDLLLLNVRILEMFYIFQSLGASEKFRKATVSFVILILDFHRE